MLMVIFKITTLLIPIAAFILGFFSLYKNPRSKVVRLWFLSSLAIGTWGMGLYMLVSAGSEAEALTASKILHGASVLIPALFFHFVSTFLFREKNDKFLIVLGYVLSLVFFVANWNSLLVSGISPRAGFEFWVNGGLLYIPFFIFFLIYVVASVIILCKGYLENDGLRKMQIFYILVAIIIGFTGGITDFFPQIFNTYPFGNFIIFLYPTIISYGVFLRK